MYPALGSDAHLLNFLPWTVYPSQLERGWASKLINLHLLFEVLDYRKLLDLLHQLSLAVVTLLTHDMI